MLWTRLPEQLEYQIHLARGVPYIRYVNRFHMSDRTTTRTSSVRWHAASGFLPSQKGFGSVPRIFVSRILGRNMSRSRQRRSRKRLFSFWIIQIGGFEPTSAES